MTERVSDFFYENLGPIYLVTLQTKRIELKELKKWVYASFSSPTSTYEEYAAMVECE